MERVLIDGMNRKRIEVIRMAWNTRSLKIPFTVTKKTGSTKASRDARYEKERVDQDQPSEIYR